MWIADLPFRYPKTIAILYFGGTLQYQVDVVGHGVTLDKFHFLLATQLSDGLSNYASKAAIKYILTALRDDRYMVFVLPFNMG